MRNVSKGKKETAPTNVVTYCYVVLYMNNGLASVDPTIYLSRPTDVGPFKEVHEFANAFAAKKFINTHVMPDTRVSVAA